jgi:hypothetical protein
LIPLLETLLNLLEEHPVTTKAVMLEEITGLGEKTGKAR